MQTHFDNQQGTIKNIETVIDECYQENHQLLKLSTCWAIRGGQAHNWDAVLMHRQWTQICTLTLCINQY